MNRSLIACLDLIAEFINEFTRDSIATLIDFEGLMKEAVPNEIRYEGYRRVENLFQHSQDITQSEWQTVNGAVVVDRNTLRLTSTHHGLIQSIDAGGHRIGDVYRFRVQLSGTGTMGIELYNSNSSEGTAQEILLTSTPTEYSVKHTFTTTQSKTLRPGIFKQIGNTVNGEITATNFQIESVTGQASLSSCRSAPLQWQSAYLPFDGTRVSYIDVPSLHNLNFPQDEATVSFEIYIDSSDTGNYKSIFHNWSGSGNHLFFRTSNYALKQYQFAAQSSGSYLGYISSTSLVYDEYLRIVLSFKAEGEIRIEVGDTPIITTTISDTNWVPDGQVLTFHKTSYPGYMRNIRIYDKQKNKGEVDANPTADLVASLLCDEGEGEIVYDTSGNAHHGTLRDFNFFLPCENPSEFTLPQWQNKSLYFPRTGDTRIDTNLMPTLSGELEAEFDYGNPYDVMIGSWNGVDRRCYLGVATTGVLGAGIGNDTYQALLVGTTTLISGITYKGKITWDQSDVFLYLKTETDGVWNDWQLEKTKTQDGDVNTSFQLTIGTLNKNDSFYTNEYLGFIRNVYIRNGLGEDVAYYKIDESEGEIAYDSSGNDNHGTIMNFNFFPKYYETKNGNTVDGAGVVTDSTGSAIAEDTKKGILIEEDRINRIEYSEEFDNAVYTKARTTVTPNTTVATDGAISADTIINTTANGYHRIYQSASSASGEFVISIFVHKDSTIPYIQLLGGSTSADDYFWANFNLATKTQGNSGTGTGDTFYRSFIETQGDWTRYAVAGNINGSTLEYFQFYLLDIDTSGVGDTHSYTGSTSENVIIWGAQNEEGRFPTSYIPTEASPVTREADALDYVLGVGKFPIEFILLMELRPVSDGVDYDDTDIRLFSTTDSRGDPNAIRTIGGVWGFSGTVFTVDKTEFSRGQKTKLAFSLKQVGSDIRAIIVKDGIEKLNTVVAGTLDHSDLGVLQIGRYNTDYFSSNYKNIRLLDCA